MKNHFNLPAIVMVVIAAAVSFTACRENTLISSKISPSKNAINIYDTTLAVITHTYYDDTAQTSTNLSGVPIYQAVGSITDPFFGTMTGATYFQVIPFNFNDSFFVDNTIDSAVLVLPYSGFTYGDTASTSATQTYQVFYLSDTLGQYTNYYSYQNKAVNTAFPLSDPYTLNVRSLRDSVTAGIYPFNNNVLPKDYPAIHIPLKLSVLKPLLEHAQDTLGNSTNPFADFVTAFKGVCVRVADTRQSGTALPYFELDGADFYSEAGILVYYHQNGVTPPVPDTSTVTSYYFSPTYCAHFNNISKSYSHYPVNNLLHSTQANDSVIALQNLPGPGIDVQIPGIMHLPEGIINKAELQFVLLPGPYNPANFQLPEKLYPTGVGSNTYPGSPIIAGLTYIIADYLPISSTSPLSVLDGYVHAETINGVAVNVFTIDIPREVMASIKAKNDVLHLQINGTQEYYGAFHMVAGGGGYADSTYRPRLFVVYSRLTNH